VNGRIFVILFVALLAILTAIALYTNLRQGLPLRDGAEQAAPGSPAPQ
jgi:hypothetical protein